MSDRKIKRVFISACEASADAHCANLIIAAKKLDPDIQFVGVGGERMQKAGCEIIENTVSRAAMIHNALSEVHFFAAVIKKAKKILKENAFDKVVVCDSPAFNFHIAKAAKKQGIKTMFYVAPQLWAWAPWRIRKLRRSCDKLACILPFEEQWFSSRGMDCEFVGNPLFDEYDGDITRNAKDYEGFDPKSAKIALLPGSRDAEIATLWKPMQQIGLQLKSRFPQMELISVAADEQKLAKLKENQLSGIEIKYSELSLIETCKEADFAFVASGSATLQVAAAGCPMAVMYQANKWLWKLIGRWLVRTKYFSLVNIVAQNELIPEFMPYFDSIQPIVEKSVNIIENADELKRISSGLIENISPLSSGITSDRVAKLMLES